MDKNKHISWIVTAGFVTSLVVVLAIALPASAQTMHVGVDMKMPPGVFGTVTAVSGETLTVTSKMRPMSTSTATVSATVYTVDASGAQVYKDGATSTIASVATGDMVMVQGTVSGMSVAATVIRDGFGGMGMMGGRGMAGGRGFGHGSTSTSRTAPVSLIQGNGEPVVGGSITAISGTTLTVTNASNVTYTVDASSAKIVKNGTSTAFSTLATGDNVIVQGTVNGTAITAASIVDSGASSGGGFGFFGAIGGFFKHLFGF